MFQKCLSPLSGLPQWLKPVSIGFCRTPQKCGPGIKLFLEILTAKWTTAKFPRAHLRQLTTHSEARSIIGAKESFTGMKSLNTMAVGIALLTLSNLSFSQTDSQQTSSCTTTIITVDASGDVSPKGVNNDDVVVGQFFDSGFAPHGFKWANGVGQIYDFPGAMDTSLFGINNRGVIVGSFDNSQEQSVGFLLDKDGQTTQFTFPGASSTFAQG